MAVARGSTNQCSGDSLMQLLRMMLGGSIFVGGKLVCAPGFVHQDLPRFVRGRPINLPVFVETHAGGQREAVRADPFRSH